MEVKVSELNGIALDWAVGVCRGVDMRVVTFCYNRKMLVTRKSVDLGGEDIYWMPSEDHEAERCYH